MSEIKPSHLKAIKPWDSVVQKSEYETVCRNILVILSRTGDTWRALGFDEYKKERLEDGHFSHQEEDAFNEVKQYTLNAFAAARFCNVWCEECQKVVSK